MNIESVHDETNIISMAAFGFSCSFDWLHMASLHIDLSTIEYNLSATETQIRAASVLYISLYPVSIYQRYHDVNLCIFTCLSDWVIPMLHAVTVPTTECYFNL